MNGNSFKLTREMRLALVGVLFVGAVGGWYVWSNSTSTNPTTETPPGTSTGAGEANNPAAPDNEAGGTTQEGGTGGVNVTRPQNPVEVQQIPFLTTTPTTPDEAEPTTTPAVTASADDALPNPFRPLDVQAAAATDRTPTASTRTGTTAPGTDTGSTGNSAPPGGVTAARPVPGTSGALPVPTIPNTPSARPSTAPGANAGVLPRPTVPGVTSPVVIRPGTVTGSAFPTPPTGVTGSSPTNTPRPLPNTPIAPNTPNTPNTGTGGVTTTPSVVTSPPVKPPKPTLTVPPVASVASAVTGATNPANAAAGTTAPGSGAATQPPVVPDVLTELSVPSGAGANTGAPVDPIDAYVQQQDLHYTAVVLGPVNTGIFATKDGYLVLSLGQTLPDSDIVVKDITATAVTLALGDSTKTIELDKR